MSGPQTADVFDGIVGHGLVIDLLRDDAARPAHAYLFIGPANVGKAAVARRFAAVLLGPDPSSVSRAVAGIHPDLIRIEPEGRTSITVDQARHAVAQASLAPMEGDRKVFLVEEAGVMNDEAANALLKTIEEPTASTVFILVAESEDELPATIASRSRTVVFGRVPEPEIVDSLAERGVERDQAVRAARISGGRPGLALALATRPEVADYRRVWLSIPARLPEHPGDAFRLADEVLAAAGGLVAGLDEAADPADAEDRAARERRERELKRAVSSLYLTGLEMLAGFYRDVAAAEFGAPVRNSDVPSAELTLVLPATALESAGRVLATAEALEANQRPRLALASLFSDLARAR